MGTGAMGKQQHWRPCQVEARGTQEPCLSRDLARPGGLRGPCLEIAAWHLLLCGDRTSTLLPIPPEASPGHWALMTAPYQTGLRGPVDKCCTGPWRTWCCQHFLPRHGTQDPGASSIRERERDGRQEGKIPSPLPPARDQAEPG